MGFPGGASWKEPACQGRTVGDVGSILGLGRSPGEGNGKLQYSCLESPMDRGDWRATIHGGTQSWTLLKQLSMHARMEASKQVKSMLN